MTEPDDDDRNTAAADGFVGGAGAAVDWLMAELRLTPELLGLAEEIRAANSARSLLPSMPKFKFERFEVADFRFGGMGLVLEALDPELERRVAIKLWAHTGAEAEAALRFEAKALARVTHPNVVTIYETGTWNGRIYFVMEWIDGLDGSEWIQRRWPWKVIRDVFVQAGRGLAAAHDAGILHRDFKPSNMLIGSDGRVRVLDFGVAEIVGNGEHENVVGSQAGTLQYMAPERLAGRRGDARSDQFSFCVTLWQALFGVLPFEGSTRAELLASTNDGDIAGDVDDPSRPRWLSFAALCGLACNPGHRFEDMHELVQVLEDERLPLELAGVDDRVDVGSEGGPSVLHGRGSSRWTWTSFWAGLGVGALGLVVFAAGGSWGPVRVITINGENRGAASPWAPDQLSVPSYGNVAITADDVIAHIRAGTFDDEIERQWTNEHEKRFRLAVPVYDDNLEIGEAFLQQAYDLLKERGQVDAAREATLRAERFARAARADLTRHGRPTDPADKLEELIDEFRGELVSRNK